MASVIFEGTSESLHTPGYYNLAVLHNYSSFYPFCTCVRYKPLNQLQIVIFMYSVMYNNLPSAEV